MQNPSAIRLRLSPVTWLCGALLHLPLFILVFLHAAEQAAWLLLLPICIGLAIGHLRQLRHQPVWLMPPVKSTTLTAGATSEGWQLCNRQGETEVADLANAFLHPWLMILDFQIKSKARRLVIWPGAVSQFQARHLRCLCALATCR